MALRFKQDQLPDGVLHVLIDDGTDVTHIFAECARWADVSRAAEKGSTAYAEACWQRLTPQAMVECATKTRLRPLRRLAGLLLGGRNGRSSS